jgi:peroxiredoxin
MTEAPMPALQPPICEFGWTARDFSLKGTDGRTYTLKDVRGPKGTLVVFLCNHCPFVRAIIDRLVTEAKLLQAMGIGVIGIMPNDTKISPGDSFPAMKDFAGEHGFTFPYVIDETQAVARAYDAVCTPDFFGFNAKDELQYRGRLDESRMEPVKGARRELYEAMKLIAETGHGPKDQISSMGCSIKWRE